MKFFSRDQVALIALMALGSAAQAGVGTWDTTGPYGGRLQNVVISPLSPNNLYLAQGRGGLFRTTNGGVNWARAEAGLPPGLSQFDLAAATNGSNVAYVLTGGAGVIYRSADFGLSWFPLPAPWAGTAFPYSITVGAGSGDRIAVTTGQTTYVSNNNGSTWTTSTAGSFLPGAEISVMALASNGDVYASSGYYDEAVYGLNMVRRSVDNGLTWTAAGALPDLDPGPGVIQAIDYVEGFVVAPSDNNRLYMAGGGLVTSADAGANWTSIPLPPQCYASKAVPSQANAVSLWVICDNTIYRTDDASVAAPVWVAMGAASNNFTVNGTDNAQAATLALHPNYPVTQHVVVGTQFGGFLRTTNNGTLWLERNDGLESTTIRALASNPLDASLLLAGFGDPSSTSVPLYRSEDGGATWAYSSSGLNAEQIRAIAIDPTTVDGNPLTTENFHVYAVGRTARIPDASAMDGGIYKSTTSGNAWATIDNGIATSSFYTPMGLVTRANMNLVRSVVLDPRSCNSPPMTGPCPSVVPATAASTLKTAYVGGTGVLSRSAPMPSCPDTVHAARIYKSTNAGVSWTASDSGIPVAQDLDLGDPGQKCVVLGGVVPVVINPSNPSILYAGTFISNWDQSGLLEPTLLNGVFKSTDGGATWVHSSNGMPRVGGPTSSNWDVLSIAINPANPNRLYATAINFVSTEARQGRVYRSDDAGLNWVRADSGIAGADVRALLVDPADTTGSTVYAGAGGTATNPGGVYRTTDAGLTWNSFSIGLMADAALALEIPKRALGAPFRILAGTIAGAWSFTEADDPDGDGAPSVVENNAPGVTTGDGNGDGNQDAGQTSVASNTGSIFGLNAMAGLAPLGGGSPVNFTLSIEGGDCAQINNSQLVEPALLPIDPRSSEIAYPLGVVRFELPSCAQAALDITFHGANFNAADWSWRNYGPTVPGNNASFAWYPLSTRATRIDADTWRINLDAGQFGVYREDTNNILMLGGPAFLPDALFQNAFE